MATVALPKKSKTKERLRALKKIQRADPEKLLRPEAVVEAASDPEHPLHDDFDWDDASAAHAHRLHQARMLINRFTIENADDFNGKRVPVFVSLMSDRKEGGYRAMDQVITSSDLLAELEATAKRELAGWMARYKMTQVVRKVSEATGIEVPKERRA